MRSEGRRQVLEHPPRGRGSEVRQVVRCEVWAAPEHDHILARGRPLDALHQHEELDAALHAHHSQGLAHHLIALNDLYRGGEGGQ